MARLKYPVGDNRNEQPESGKYTFKLCPKPCKIGGVVRSEICKGGVETSDSTNAEVSEWTVLSQNGDFNHENNLELSDMCPSGVYSIEFITNLLYSVHGPGRITNILCYKGADVSIYMMDSPYTPRQIMTFKAIGWTGVWVRGDRIDFTVVKNDPGQYEKLRLKFDLCPKKVGENTDLTTELTKCGSEDQLKYTFCLCPKWVVKPEKCGCNYEIKDLHWYIQGGPNEEYFVFNWINPETCCTNWIRLSTLINGIKYIEYCGTPLSGGEGEVLRSEPNSPASIYPDGSEEFKNFVFIETAGDGWVCDRLHWALVLEKYGVWTHGILVGGVPGEFATVDAWIVDELCTNPVMLGSIYLETVGLVGGSIKQIWDISKREYIVTVKGYDMLLKSTDFTRYHVGDWVAVQKLDAKPPVGYPSIVRWLDENGDWHDPIPYITDQNVPKVDPDGRLTIFTSLNFLPDGYYGSDFIGDPMIAKIPKNELMNGTAAIIGGRLSGQSRTIVDVMGDKLKVAGPSWNPDASCKFKILSPNIYGTSNLRIIPYDFKFGPSYLYRG